MAAERFVRVAILIGTAFFLVTGAWAFGDSRSFYEQLANYPPYNRHFLHDLGAFQLGLAAGLALALTSWSGRRVGLWAAAVAAVLHAVSHFVDRGLGGRASDPFALSVLAALLVVAAVLAGRPARRATGAGSTQRSGS